MLLAAPQACHASMLPAASVKGIASMLPAVSACQNLCVKPQSCPACMRTRHHLMSRGDIPGLPLGHLWDEAQLVIALLYQLLQLHGELLLHLLVTSIRLHCRQPASHSPQLKAMHTAMHALPLCFLSACYCVHAQDCPCILAGMQLARLSADCSRTCLCPTPAMHTACSASKSIRLTAVMILYDNLDPRLEN